MPNDFFPRSLPEQPLPLEGVLDSINAMTAKLRRSEVAPSPDAAGEGWWVLAVGEDMEDMPFAERDRAREALRRDVEALGIVLPEHVWVWDESSQAQLVIATLPTLKRARLVADRLREKGLRVRVVRETA